MPILVCVAAMRVTGSPSGYSPAAEYAVFALLALALGLIALCFMKARTGQTPKPEAERKNSRWSAFLRPH